MVCAGFLCGEGLEPGRGLSSIAQSAREEWNSYPEGRAAHRLQCFRQVHLPEDGRPQRDPGPDDSYLYGGQLSCALLPCIFFYGPPGRYGIRGELLYRGNQGVETYSGCCHRGCADSLLCGRSAARHQHCRAHSRFHPDPEIPGAHWHPLLCRHP